MKVDDWWETLTNCLTLYNLSAWQMSSKFKVKRTNDLDVTWNVMRECKIVPRVDELFLIEWENKGWKNTWHTTRMGIAITRIHVKST